MTRFPTLVLTSSIPILLSSAAQAHSDIDNPFMFQGTRHFAIDAGWSDTTAKLPLNHHRARFADPIEGQWVTRDPLTYIGDRRQPSRPVPKWIRSLEQSAGTSNYDFVSHHVYGHENFLYLASNPPNNVDWSGLFNHSCSCDDPANRQALQTRNAMTFCCLEYSSAGPSCQSQICYHPTINTSTCPGICIKEHENVRAQLIDCQLVGCPPILNCRSGLAYYGGQPATIGSDCAAWSAQYACLIGQCNQWGGLHYKRVAKCMRVMTCEHNTPAPLAWELCNVPNPRTPNCYDPGPGCRLPDYAVPAYP